MGREGIVGRGVVGRGPRGYVDYRLYLILFFYSQGGRGRTPPPPNRQKGPLPKVIFLVIRKLPCEVS